MNTSIVVKFRSRLARPAISQSQHTKPYSLRSLGIFLALFSVVTTAQINPYSSIQVPLPTAFGEPDSVSVSAATGAIFDSIPIEVAPGRHGIKPPLSLAFSSMAGTGVAGLGWGINTGNVERWRGDGTPSVKATIAGIANDRYSYSLGGAGGELHDENGDDVYRARIESVYRPFRKVGDGWQVFDGQGVAYSFGSMQESRIDGELWLLDRVEDSSGNTILYRYKTECQLAPTNCDSGSETRYLGSIHYTGYAPTANQGTNEVTFAYEQRPDRRVSYRRGVREAQNLRLLDISARAQGSLVRRYRLTYDQFAQGPSLLTGVTLFGSDNTSAIVLRTIDYGQRIPGWPGTATANVPVDLADADGKGTGAQLMDVNGDNYADLVDNGVTVYLGNGLGSFTMSASWTNSLPVPVANIIGEDGIDTGVRFMDVDGDARPDILIATPDRSEIWLNTGAGWQLDNAWTTSLGNLSALNIALTDANATTNCLAALCEDFGMNPPAGCSEFCPAPDPDVDPPEGCLEQCTNDPMDPPSPMGCIPVDTPFCAASSATNFTTPTTEPFSLVGEVGESKGVEFADVNADGRVDIVWSLLFDQSQFQSEFPRIVRAVFLNGGSDNPGWHQSNNLSTALGTVLNNEGGAAGAFIVENAYQGYSFMDANGDGFADLVRSIEGKQAVYLGNGSGWSLDTGYTNSMVNQGIFALDADLESQGLIPLDLNDDGLSDYLLAKGTGTGAEFQVYINTGSGWAPNPAQTTALANSAITFVSDDGKATGATLADIDGNGVIDLVSASAVTSPDRILLGDTFRAGKLEQTVSALGQVTQIQWIASTDFDNITDGGIEGLPIPMTLVDSISRTDGRGNTLVSQFEYAGGLYTSSGYRGFREVTQTPSQGLTTTTKYYQDETRASQPFELSSYDSLGKRRSRSLTTATIHVVEPGVEQVLLARTETRRYDPDQINPTTTSVVEREFNDYLQATSVFSDQQVEVSGEERTAQYQWLDNQSAGFWGLMTNVTSRGPALELLSEAITLYDTKGRPMTLRELVDTATSVYVETNLEYDQYGNVTRVVDRTGNATTFVYDSSAAAFREQATDPLGRIRRSEYHPGFGTLVRDVDASGNATTTSYDVFGGKQRVVAPGDESSTHGTVSYDYANIGNPVLQSFRVRRTERAGTSDTFDTVSYFDAVGRIYKTREEGPAGVDIVTVVNFDESGQASETSLPHFDGYTPEFIVTDRDDLGRLTTITDPLGQAIAMSYQGFKIDVLDGRGNTTTAIVNAAGNPAQISMTVDNEVQTTHYEYYASGHLKSVIDALGTRTTISYDALARRTMLEDPNAGLYHYQYDGEGRLVEQAGPGGTSLLLEYSPAGELRKKTLPDGSTQTFQYGDATVPNGVGQLVQVDDAAGNLKIAYDARGRVSERRRTVDGRTYITRLSYDSMDRIVQVIYPDGFIANYAYDNGNNLAAVTDKAGRPVADGFEYNASKRITNFEFGNGVTTDYEYDPMARMLLSRSTTGTGVDLQELSYTYDSANNVLSMDDLTSGRNQAFEYDEANRLTRAVGPYGEETYVYDAVGNLLRKGDLHFAHDPLRPQRVSCGVETGINNGGGQSQGSGVDACAQSLASIDPSQVLRAFAIEYDERGNMIAKGSRHYEYDGENRLVTALEENGRIIEQNRYDASGQLIVKQDQNEKTVYIDGLYEEGKTHVSRHIRAGSLLIASVVTPRAQVKLIAQANPPRDHSMYTASISGAGILLLLLWLDRVFGGRARRALNQVLAMCRYQPLSVALVFLVIFSTWSNSGYAASQGKGNPNSEQRFYYHANHLGSVNVVTDDKSKVTARRDYRPYGDADAWAGTNSGPRELLQTFQGQQFDDDTGLYYFKARYYDAELGRFMSADTVVADSNDPRTMNRYAFAGGNPIQFVDPTGRSFWSAVGNFFVNDVGGAFQDAGAWIADNALEILTVVAIVAIVVLIVAVVVLTGGLAAIALGGGLGAVAGFAGLGAAAGFAVFGGIALAQGNTLETAAFWQAAGTGLVLGALVGAAIPVAFAPSALFAGGITSFAGSVAAGALIGAASGGLEQAIACATGCGGVENLFLPVAQGVLIGGVIGAIGGGVANKFLPRGGPFYTKVLRFMAEPGKIGFTLKAAYSSYSSADGPGLSGRRTLYGDGFRLLKIGFGTSDESIGGFTRGDQSSYFFGTLDNANTGLATAPMTP